MNTTNYQIEAAAPANVRPSSVSKTRAFAAHNANRELSTQTVLSLLKAQLPKQYELAEIVGHVIIGNGNRSSLRELGYFYA